MARVVWTPPGRRRRGRVASTSSSRASVAVAVGFSSRRCATPPALPGGAFLAGGSLRRPSCRGRWRPPPAGPWLFLPDSRHGLGQPGVQARSRGGVTAPGVLGLSGLADPLLEALHLKCGGAPRRELGAVMPWVNACWWSMRSWRMTGTPRPRTAGAPLRLVVLAGVDPRPVQHDGGWLQREARDVQRCRWRASLGRGRPPRTGRLRQPQPVPCPPCVAANRSRPERRDPLGVPADGTGVRSTASATHPKGPSIKAASPGGSHTLGARPPVGVGLPWQHGRSRSPSPWRPRLRP